jgi:hypothetical protein
MTARKRSGTGEHPERPKRRVRRTALAAWVARSLMLQKRLTRARRTLGRVLTAGVDQLDAETEVVTGMAETISFMATQLADADAAIARLQAALMTCGGGNTH